MNHIRTSIGLGKKYNFGTEIEFTGVYLSNLYKLLQERNLNAFYVINHKSKGFTKYDEWYLDVDSTVSERINEELFGGEFSSRILTDDEASWIEIEKICKCLFDLGANIDGRCSNQIRVDLSTNKNESYFFEALAKIIAIYETDILHFYMGDKYEIRKLSYKYARLLCGYLLEYINTVDFNNSEFFYNFRSYNNETLFTRRCGINLADYKTKRLVEVRYPNGTINAKTIQNNINFTLKLFDAIIREVFDIEKLTYIIEHEKDKIMNNFLFYESDPKNFETLVKSISTSSEDENDFFNQYERVLRTKK